jgi:hypothetical protein
MVSSFVDRTESNANAFKSGGRRAFREIIEESCRQVEDGNVLFELELVPHGNLLEKGAKRCAIGNREAKVAEKFPQCAVDQTADRPDHPVALHVQETLEFSPILERIVSLGGF